MLFKRLRVLRGNSLVIPVSDNFETVVKAEITNGSGVPIGRMNYDQEKNTFILSSQITTRLTGHYKYHIVVTKGSVVETIQYGIIEVM
ncbi:hypothetical protein EX461_18085 [Vibrio parahaemolyticus]|nr:hypothetical protein [Vibrio parahaemolyticus]EJG0012990.1 hypothetical protein [Vibrio parahaemolyticus]EJG0782060.1 hypothetical protein [Vibrio parahaemolyticus]EJS9799271.1 hypothetical protein [Vibrio parahaemolyticus]